MFGGSIPIYHGIDGANVRRFQGIFDGPNPAAFFLLMYSGVLAYYFRSAKKYYFLLSLWSIVLVTLLVYTYSRSALIGFCVGMMVFLVLHARTLFQKHWKTLIILGSVFFLLMGFFVVKKEGTLDRIILREGSSRGHFDRSLIGLQRAVDKPLGSGLATSGPAYRYVQHPEEDESLFEGDNKKREDYSIPESWYIQQMVEGGAPGFAIFIAIM